MESKQDGEKKARRIFTAEEKFEILKEIERCQTIKEGLAKHQLADQLQVGVRASLRNVRPFFNINPRILKTRVPQQGLDASSWWNKKVRYWVAVSPTDGNQTLNA